MSPDPTAPALCQAGAAGIARHACVVSLGDWFPPGTTAADAGGPPEWVHLVPAGSFSGRDGRGPYRLDADAVIARFHGGGVDLPVDYEHQMLSAAEKAGPVPAAGWITDLEERPDGLWGRVRWTERAAELLAAREYRYVSPVFRHLSDGTIVELLGAGLVHAPNLHLAAAASREDIAAHAPETGEAAPAEPDLRAALAELLGLPDDAGIGAAIEAVLSLKARAALLDQVAEVLGLPVPLSVPQVDVIVAAARSLRARAETPDPAAWVPLAQHRALAEELAALQREVADREAAAAVAEAVRAGKLPPALAEWAQGYARRDPDGFRAFVAAAPAFAPTGRLDRPEPRQAPEASDVIAAAEALMRQAAEEGRRMRFADAIAAARRRHAEE